MRRRYRFLALAPTLSLLLGVSAADAQGRLAPRPFESLFGGTRGNDSKGQSLDLIAAVGAASDSNTLGSGDLVGSLFNSDGIHTSLSSAINYAVRLDRVQVGASAGIDGRYYSKLGELVSTNKAADAFLDVNLGRTTFSVRQGVAASPVHYSELFPTLRASTIGDTGATLGAYTLTDLLALRYSSSASLGFQLGRRTSVEFDAMNGFTDFGEGSAFLDERAYSLSGRLIQRFWRDAGVRFGYGYRKGVYRFDELAASADLHDLDIGIDYDRALSLTRRTSLRFAATSSILTSPSADLQNRLVYWFGGTVGLSYEIGRSWETEVTYDRGTRLVAGLSEPVFSNGIIGRVSGAITRRVELDTSAGVAFGTVGFGLAGDHGFNTYSAQTRVQYSISRMWAVHGQYRFYNHDFGADVIVPEEVPTLFGHHGIEVGLSLWVPLLRR